MMKKFILLVGIMAIGGCAVTHEQIAASLPINKMVVKADKEELIKCTVYRMRDKWKNTSLLGIFVPKITVEQISYGNVTELVGYLSGEAQFIMKFTDQGEAIEIQQLGDRIFKNEPWDVVESCLS